MSQIKPINCLVLQPFGKRTVSSGITVDFDEVFNYIKKIEDQFKDFPISVTRADMQLLNINLWENVVANIRNSDLCIADITAYNPNVMYELGVAWGLDKNLIILLNDIEKNVEELPADLRGIIVVSYSMHDLNNLINQISPHLERVRISIESQKPIDAYVEYYARANNDNLIRYIKGAHNSVYILMDNLIGIHANLIDHFAELLSSRPKLIIRTLSLDPKSPIIDIRARQLCLPVDHLRKEMEFAIEAMQIRLKEFGDQLQMRLYDDYLGQYTIMADDKIYVCIISTANIVLNNCAFLIDKTNEGAQTFLNEFQRLWNIGIPISA